MNKLSGTSADILSQNIDNLKQLFPEVFTEDKIDFDRLKEVLGNYVDAREERYRFEWNGKSKALRMAQTQSTGTLRPCKEESKNWDTTENLYIEGDNLEVLKLLQKTYHNSIKMIYIDPPYNTGGDFVYKDDFKDNIKNYLKITGQTDEEGKKLSTNSETSGRYHTDWLNMMYPRLRLARNLLSNDGIIFISIDDNEVDNLKKICNEIFGEDNNIAQFARTTKKAGKSSEDLSKNNDYLLLYKKSSSSKLQKFSHTDTGFRFEDEFIGLRGKYKLNQTLDYGSIQYSPSLDYEILLDGHILRPGNATKEEMLERQKRNPVSDFCWRWSKDLFEFGLKNGFIVLKESNSGYRIYTKTYEKATISKNGSYEIEYIDRTKPVTTLEFFDNKYSNDNSRKDLAKLFSEKVFDYSKPVSLLKCLSYLGSKDGDIILDFFAGSATTAHAVMKLNSEDGGNRKFIMVQLPEPTDEKSEAYKAGYKNICEIGKERIRRAGEKIKEELQGQQMKIGEEPKKVPDIGFKVFKLDSSNLKKWNPDYDNLEKTMMDMVSNYVDGRSEEDVLYEIMLKYGVDLTLPMEIELVNSKKVFNIGYGALFICLDDNIEMDVAEYIISKKNELQPKITRVVFKDNGFKNDDDKANVEMRLERAGFDDIVSV